jgi:cytochrome c-type biogenesis protein CcmH/NrfG
MSRSVSRVVFGTTSLPLLSLALVFGLFSAAISPEALAKSSALQSGIQLYKQNLVVQAIGQLEKAKAQTPQSSEVYYWLGNAYKKQGGIANQQKAITAYKKALSLNANNANSAFAAAELLSWKDATRPEAIRLYQQGLSASPNNTPAKRALAENLIWESRFNEAQPYADSVYNTYKNDSRFLENYALLLIFTNRPAEAVRLYESAPLKISGKSPFSHKQAYALALAKSGRSDLATSALNLLLAETPKPTAKQREVLSGVAYECQQYELAVRLADGVPSPTKSLSILKARSLAQAGRAQEAIALFQSLYKTQQLTAIEKLEYADFLTSSQNPLPLSALASPDLPETLYKESIPQYKDKPALALRLARYYARPDVNRTEDALNFYRFAAEQAPQSGARKEFFDFLQSNTLKKDLIYQTFEDLLKEKPNDTFAKASYAEVLSWEDTQRVKALTLYLELMQSDSVNTSAYLAKINTVLQWDFKEGSQTRQSRSEYLAVYNQILAVDPQNLWAAWAKGRALWLDSQNKKAAVAVYSEVAKRYPSETKLQMEYAGLLGSLTDGASRKQALALMKELLVQDPQNETLQVIYAQNLSYDARYDQAIRLFNDVLKNNPDQKQALAGKALTLLWSGQPLAATRSLEESLNRFPNDPTLTLAQAQAYRQIGRLDKALNLLQQVKQNQPMPMMGEPSLEEVPPATEPVEQPDLTPSQGFESAPVPQASRVKAPPVVVTLPTSKQVASNKGAAPKPSKPKTIADRLARQAKTETRLTEIAPAHRTMEEEPIEVVAPSEEVPEIRIQGTQTGDTETPLQESFLPDDSLNEKPLAYLALSVKQETTNSPPAEPLTPATPTVAKTPSVAKPASAVETDLEILERSTEVLKQLRQQTQSNLDSLNERLDTLERISPQNMKEQSLNLPTHQPMASQAGQHLAGQAAMVSTQEGLYGSALASEQSSYARTLGLNDAFMSQAPSDNTDWAGTADTLTDLDQGIQRDLRPSINTSFIFSTQEGDDTTYGLRSFAFPNQLALSLTPQLRVRGGYALRRFWLAEDSILPRSTYGHQVSVGATYQPLDRLTLDGDLSLTQFSQSDTSNWTYQARAIYQANDRIKATVGMRRTPFVFSLLSNAGVTPDFGQFGGQLVGQVRENAAFAELALGPWKNADWNLGYEFAWIDGNNTPRNTKNQAQSSLGYTWKFNPNHKVRLSHELLFFGFAKDATNGFVDVLGRTNSPVASLLPLSLAANGNVYGGYFSPDWFLLNQARLEFRGNFLDKKLEYRLGGSIGVQAFNSDVVGQSDPTSLATRGDAMLIYNVSDALSLYGLTEFLDSGGLFNRWRFGGGVLIRPEAKAFSPVFGK